MKRAFDRAGVDFDQWKALTIAALKIDVRSAQGVRGNKTARQGPFATQIAGQFLIFSGLGVVIAVFVWVIDDAWLAASVGAAYAMFTIGMIVFLDHNSIVSPADYVILAPHPVTSRTYFAARLANALVFTTAFTAMLAWLPVLSFLFRYGPAAAGAAMLSFLGSSTATTLAILAAYAAILRTFGAERIRRVLSYAQLIMSFAMYGGFLAGTDRLARVAAARGALSRSRWLLLAPPTWFGSYVEIARGHAGGVHVVLALASIALLAGLASTLGGRLSLDYSQRIAESMARSESRPGRAGRAWTPIRLFAAGEARAVALLIRSQFQNDLKFRLAVLSILPLTLFYALYGGAASIHDPFEQAARPGAPLLLIAVLMFPATLRTQLTSSDAFRASWIFFATPTDRMRVIRAAKNVVVVLFLLPYLGFLAAIFMYMTGSIWHVLVHLALIGFLSHLGLQVLVLLDPALPFSRPLTKGQSPGLFFGFMMVGSVIALLLEVFSPFLYASRVATAAAFALVAAASAIVDRRTRARVEQQTAALEFGG